MTGAVEEIWRYPLKSAQGEALQAAAIGPDGPHGDRSWACLSAQGAVVSAKNPRRWGRLLCVRACLKDGVLVLRIPGAPPVRGDDPAVDRILSGWLGEPVRVTNVVPAHARLERRWPSQAGMIPDWAGGAQAGACQFDVIPGARPGGRFVDFGAVHIVTTQELSRLSGQGVDADVRRFRPNLVLDLASQPAPDDQIRVGPEVVLRAVMPTPRCAVPGAAQAGVARAPDLLRALGRDRTEIAGRGRAAAFGIYAAVLTPGSVSVGDDTTVIPAPPARPEVARQGHSTADG